jgi:hypothetical protein
VTTAEKVLAVLAVEIQRHALFLNSTDTGVRSIQVVVKLTPEYNPRVVISNFETERVYGQGERRTGPVEIPALTPLPRPRPRTMGDGPIAG